MKAAAINGLPRKDGNFFAMSGEECDDESILLRKMRNLQKGSEVA